ncbi:hypothetical protein ABFX02_13G141400 [Erythranthe guttata]
MVTHTRQRGFSLFIICLFTIVNYSLKFTEGIRVSDGAVKLELIHRHHLQGERRNVAAQPLERLRQLVHSDAVRLRGISLKVMLIQGGAGPVRRRVRETDDAFIPASTNGGGGGGSKNKEQFSNVSGQLPISSGADFGTGQYFVQFRVGSPAQKVVLIADTGSDLTWMNCKYRCRGGGGGGCRRNSNKRRLFWADRSSSFRTVPCSSTTCTNDLANLFSLTRCPSPISPCAYDYRYSDGSAAQGLFGNETVTLSLTNGRKTRLHNVLIGCSISSSGPTFQSADGVIGLGYSNYSLAVKASNLFRGIFSYCLVDHLSPKNISSYLTFGSAKQQTDTMHYTALILDVINPFYAVSMNGISIGGSMLDIPAEVWDVKGSGGVILDSGTSLTSLVGPAYRPVMAALTASLSGFEKLGLDVGPLEYCFNSTGFVESVVPRLVFHFGDGARFEPPVKSYVIDAAPGVKCLGFVGGAWPGVSVVGNIMQQNYFWEFDLVNRRLGFGSSSCK